MPKSRAVVREQQLGTRKVTAMNFSRLVTLPLEFVKNLDENMLVNVSISPDAKKVILTPAHIEKKVALSS